MLLGGTAVLSVRQAKPTPSATVGEESCDSKSKPQAAEATEPFPRGGQRSPATYGATWRRLWLAEALRGLRGSGSCCYPKEKGACSGLELQVGAAGGSRRGGLTGLLRIIRHWSKWWCSMMEWQYSWASGCSVLWAWREERPRPQCG